MNFLAHIFLSGDSDLTTIGNFMADGIKGKDYRKYSKELQIGILKISIKFLKPTHSTNLPGGIWDEL